MTPQQELEERKIKKMKPYTQEWHKAAYALLCSALNVRPCRDCGYPVIEGYCCNRCGSTNP